MFLLPGPCTLQHLCKQYASHDHQPLRVESWRRQKAKQLLMQGVGKVSVDDTLCQALAAAQAIFNRLLPRLECGIQ